MKKVLLVLTLLCATFQLSAQTAAFASVKVDNTTSEDKFITIHAMYPGCTTESIVTYHAPPNSSISIPAPTSANVRYQYAEIRDTPVPTGTGHELRICAQVPPVTGAPPFCGGPPSITDCAGGTLDAGYHVDACWSQISNTLFSIITINY